MSSPRIVPVGDAAILVEFGQDIDPAIQAQVAALAQILEEARHPVIREWVPTYRSIMIHYYPSLAPYEGLAAWLHDRIQMARGQQAVSRRRVTIPVLYGGEMGPDLDAVAAHTKLSPDEIIALHQEPDYLVYMLGFLPGFPYLGGLDPRLVTPRLATPRTQVPAGSVGIADAQTGIYPLTSPGGWQLIGRTPVKLFDPEREEPFLLAAGDILRFRAIDQNEYDSIAAAVAAGTYEFTAIEPDYQAGS
ncbi:MAG: 5-oxoprolinase subunit PxpB [Firmicutes bacterium]|nr:5-oxoprolinase subunit PxpB [Bacillota bacterium]